MDTTEIAVLIYFGLSLKIALTVVALTIVYKMRLQSAKGARKLKREGGQRKESAREEKTESRPVLKSSSGRDIHKRAISSGKKPLKPGPAVNKVPAQAQKIGKAAPSDLKPGPAANKVPPQTQKTGKAAPSEGIGPSSSSKKINPITFSPRNKAGEQIEPTEVRKQAQPKSTAPVKSSEPKVALKDDSVSRTALPGAPRGQSAITEPKSGEKPHHEPSAGNTGGGERSEASMDTKPDTQVNQASSEPPAATTDSGETDQETPQTGKSGLGDLADLFATSASEFTEKSKLAEQVNEVDVNDILQEGLGLLGKVKKKSDG